MDRASFKQITGCSRANVYRLIRRTEEHVRQEIESYMEAAGTFSSH